MTISGERTEQLDIFCCVTGFTGDFLSFIDVELILFFFLSWSPSIAHTELKVCGTSIIALYFHHGSQNCVKRLKTIRSTCVVDCACVV